MMIALMHFSIVNVLALKKESLNNLAVELV
jgi:hypothetical protein